MEKEKHKKQKHHQPRPVSTKKLLLATLLNFVITIAEIAGGIISNSLALLSDALHNLSDTFATFIAYLAKKKKKKGADAKNTFGYKRIEILAALLNAVILIIICLYLFKEAWERMNDPQPINSLIMIVVAMIGLIANVLAVAILHHDSKKSINVKAAYVHLIGDSLSSVVVIIAAAVIQIWEIYWIDPLITVLIGLYIIREAWVILKEAVNILMQSTPDNLNIRKLKARVEAFHEVKNLHHLHAWTLDDRQIHLEAHIELHEDLKLSEIKPLRQKIEKMLKSRFHIHHLTLQFEFQTEHGVELIGDHP